MVLCAWAYIYEAANLRIALPGSVIGNTAAFGAAFPGSSPGRAAFENAPITEYFRKTVHWRKAKNRKAIFGESLLERSDNIDLL